MTATRTASLVPETVAAVIEGYRAYRSYFHEITSRAMDRFVQGDWQGMQSDAVERLESYQVVLEQVVAVLSRDLGRRAGDRDLWAAARSAAASQMASLTDPELAETFFNSVVRRLTGIIGADPRLEFLRSDPPPLPDPVPGLDYDVLPADRRPLHELCREMLARSPFGPHLRDLDGDARRLSRHLAARRGAGDRAPARIEMVPAPFFRGMGAYLIGRIVTAEGPLRPLAIAFVNEDPYGIVVDGLIDDERGIRLLFSYTHSYFHVRSDRIAALVAFLQPLLPHRRRAELYISLGFNRHGKTELYRDLGRHQNACRDQFVISPGKPGMVMAVFNMPSDDLVFKVIRDRFAQPKRTTRPEVMAKYAYVFRHDRTGRLPDTQAFDHLKFERGCFHPALLEELETTAARSVDIDAGSVAIALAYVERRVQPLDLYIRQAPPDAARQAVVDFGQAIKDLACSNLFPGDMLLKNFGVTGLGRVIFYDFDEVCPLTDCRFRRKPPARAHEDELAAEPWYYVAPNDVFPEEFESFLGLDGDLKGTFLAHHGDLLDVDFWRRTQKAILADRPPHVFPYVRWHGDGTGSRR